METKQQKIYLASDHAGFKLKGKLIKHLQKSGYRCINIGPETYNKDDDYPDFIIPAARRVARDKTSKGIILGGSGQGEALAANKVKGIRAIVYYGGSKEIIKLSRQHNDANILSLGARFVSEATAKQVVDLWLKTKFSKATRHMRRLKKVSKFEK